MNQTSPALVAQDAVRRLPRWALWLLCVAYVVPGYVGRDPWKNADVAAFGVMLDLAGDSSWSTWLHPGLMGIPADISALLPYWIGAWVLQWTPAWVAPDFAVRVPFMLMLAATLAATWSAVYDLARHPGAQPVVFAFGGEAKATDYARALADGGLLALVATLGLAQFSHETTPALAQLFFATLVFAGLAGLPFRPRGAPLMLLIGLPGLVLSGAPSIALIYGGVATLGLLRPSADHLAPATRWRALVLLGACTLACALLGWSTDLLHWQIATPASDWQGARALGQLFLWFTWPAWPLALWTLWRWRRQLASAKLQRHLLLPLAFVAVALGAALTTRPADRALLLGLPPLAALAALALPTLRRSMAALIDWFTLLFFTVSAIAVWVIWISTQTGIPAKPAANVAKLAPGFVPEFSLLALAVALAATLGWCMLVAWRTGRHRAAIWKSLVLPAAGATLGWLLLLTLWLPMLNYARSDAPQVRALLAPLGAQSPGTCAVAHGLNRNQVAALQYHGGLRMQPAASGVACHWLVTAQPLREYASVAQGQWQLRTRAARPTDRADLLLLYQRNPAP